MKWTDVRLEYFAAQNGKCAVCSKPIDLDTNANLDHDHETNHVRGLVCTPCNRNLSGYDWFIRNKLRVEAYLAATPRYRKVKAGLCEMI